MYREFFGLKKRPFILTPDPEFLYLSKVHDLAITHLEYGIVQNAGFLALTGEVGAGKTTLLKYLFEKVKDSLDIAMLFNTNLDPHAFLEMLVREFELKAPSSAKTDLFDTLAQHFIQQYSKGNRCVIIVDEAQNLPDETFEELRMLSNLEAENEFMVQIILVGQPQLRDRLLEPALSQLAQRISIHFHLTALQPNEVKDYIEHRLKVAGYSDKAPLFDDQSVRHIAKVSKGIPRIINSVCDACLTYAFADDLRQVSKPIVEKVIEDNELLQIFIDQKRDQSLPQSLPTTGRIQGHELQELRNILIKVAGRIESLEKRIEALEVAEKDRVVGVLEGMLAKERQRNMALEKRLLSIGEKFKRLQRQLGMSDGNNQDEDNNPNKKEGKYWRLFGENMLKK